MRSSAKSLVLDLLSAAPEGELSVKGLVRAAALFDIAENSVRVALARLRSAELVESAERGVYTLGPAAGSINRHVSSWRDTEKRCRKWDGSWIAVHTAGLGRSDRVSLRRRERALTLFGFRELERGLEVRPNNLKGGMPALRERLIELGLEPEALVFRADHFDEHVVEHATSLWDAEALEETYVSLRQRLETEYDLLETRDLESAAREAFLLGGEAVRQIILDPLLPTPIVDVAERRAFINAMRRFDKRGQGVWHRFLTQSGAFELGDAVESKRGRQAKKMSSPTDLSGVDREGAATAASADLAS